MTGNVLEIGLKGPRPNFLQLLAQPEMAILRGDLGTGPYRSEKQEDGAILLTLPQEEGAAEPEQISRDVVLRGEAAPLAIVRFRRGLADLVTAGTVGDLAYARAAALRGNPLRFDPVGGLFGLAFGENEGVLADPGVRRALSMAIDRPGFAAALGVPEAAPRDSILPAGLEDVPAPALPDWAAAPLPMRRASAARLIAEAAGEEPVRLSVAVPPAPGYRLLFAHLRRDWRAIGVTAEAVAPEAKADLRLIDTVAAAQLATWYLRRFSCASSAICSAEVDTMLNRARTTQNLAERQALLASADRALAELTPFIPLGAPVRWSLVGPRLTGFQPNPFGRRFLGSLLAPRR
jgi:peptide/nickel transport system substrate-binding protein